MAMPIILNRALRLEQSVDVPDGAGGFVKSWDAMGVIWGHVAARSGSGGPREFGASGRLSLIVTVRYAPQGRVDRPLPGQRFVDGTRSYAIEAVHEADTRGHYLKCYAEEERPL
jgi:head-tail adaptor